MNINKATTILRANLRFTGSFLMALFMMSFFVSSSFAANTPRATNPDYSQLNATIGLSNTSFGEFRNNGDTWYNTFTVCTPITPGNATYTSTRNGWGNPDNATNYPDLTRPASCYDPSITNSTATFTCSGSGEGNWGDPSTTNDCGRSFQLCDQVYSYVKTWQNAVISGTKRTVTTWTRIVSNNRVNCRNETGTSTRMTLRREIDNCVGSPTKGACITTLPGDEASVTATTGDDMFKILANGDGTFFEYKNIGDFNTPGHRLKYINSTAGVGGISLMLPSGPPGVYSDYNNFMDLADAGNIDGVTTQDACYAMDTSLCGPLDASNDEPGACGSANSAPARTYGSLSEIPYQDFCSAGVVVNETQSGNTVTWRCYATTNSPVCSATVGPPAVTNALCGSANGGTSAPSTNAQYCSRGTKTAIVGTWTWACNGANGGTNRTCSATPPPPINGACGSSNNSCTRGNLVNTADSPTQYLWRCNGSNGGSNASCSRAKPVAAPACGPAHNQTYNSSGPPTSQRCSRGTVSGFRFQTAGIGTSPGTWTWKCVNGSQNVSCFSRETAISAPIKTWGAPYRYGETAPRDCHSLLGGRCSPSTAITTPNCGGVSTGDPCTGVQCVVNGSMSNVQCGGAGNCYYSTRQCQ